MYASTVICVHETYRAVPQRRADQKTRSNFHQNRSAGCRIDPARHRRLSRKGESEVIMRRAREQSGYIYKRGGWWVLRYRENVLEGGELKRRQLAKQIEQVSPEHMRLKRAPPEIEDKAKAMLQPLNNHTYTPEATQSLEHFVEHVYFPNIEVQKRASTVKGYKARWAFQLKPRCAQYRLRDFRTSDAQRLLAGIARGCPELR